MLGLLFSITYVNSRSCGKRARRSHNPEVGGSNPPPAIMDKSSRNRHLRRFLLFLCAADLALV
jgi:hypothetical protein